MTHWMRRIALAALCMMAVAGCKKAPKEQLYFDDLKPPIGSGKVTVVSDVSKNLETGGEILVQAVVEPDLDKDELTKLMESFYRQASKRKGFQRGDKPDKIDMRFYDSEAKAKAAGDDWLARVYRAKFVDEPTYENKQKAPLLKWAKQALGTMPEFTGELKPQLLADADNMALEITYPFVEHDGKGQYVEELSYERFTSDWSSMTYDLFTKIEGLKKLTFIGKHKDQVVAKIWLTREQYDAMELKDTLEEELSAYQGQFVTKLLSREITEEKVQKLVAKQRRKVFRELLGKLPPEQVELQKDFQ